ncbi:MAG TPA: FAD-linked oxidase C-terminal domain-containing protein, partial [Vicinamibacterales bacterium]|nr:FAD-linked oxidase C-terminal domain-containing protein [Vicinamibacterales bacterium]
YQIEPLGVVVARNRDDIIATVRLCHEFRCPLTLRGGGTSQAGQTVGSGIILDTSKYVNRLLDVDIDRRIARVEPGIVLDELNAQLKPHNLRFAPDISTASRATLGGMMANNSAGARSVLYGITLHHVLEQEVVFADGSVARLRDLAPPELDALCAEDSIHGRGSRVVRRLASECAEEIERRYPKLLRRVAGYNLNEFAKADQPFNLSRLMVGSEGTLGVVIEATVKLVPLPKAKAVMAIEFATLLEALEAAPLILRHAPSAVEVMDKFILDHTTQNAELQRRRQTFISGDPGALLCVEFYGDRAEDLPPRLQALERHLSSNNLGYRYFHALDPAAQARIWSVREAGLGLSMAMKDDNKSLSFVEDTAVAPERLRDYIDRFLTIVRAHGTSAGVYAHASVGCLHVRPVVNLKTEAGVKTFESLATAISDLVLEFNGALSGEHGDGLVRSPFMRKMFGPVLYDAFREIKRTFDPHGILNPGKIVDAPPLVSNLRYGPAYRSRVPETWFDYSAWGGMNGAVEMCSGLGACRKTLDGTMCPSYMATKEEAHSTRGRANALRLVMAGRLDESGLGDEGVRKVLDLCLECRACKAECPVGVDVARFKSEFLADYWSRHGTPLHARALGHVHALSVWASRMPGVANALINSAPVRALNARLLGVHPDRALPRWASRTLRARWLDGTRQTPVGTTYLFNDTFTNYFHPEIGLAARTVLEATGVTVGLAANVCCGRPLISKGLLKDARDLASRNTKYLASLLGRAEAGHYIFLEPSCLSAIREDVPALLRGEEQQQALRVAESCISFEEFVGHQMGRPEGRALPIEGGPSRILLHGHCHQKSMGSIPAAKALLERIPGAQVVDLDAGCCGMAGSFGYAREHFDVSRQIGERRLLPAARGLKPGEILVAAGTSCRQQVADFTGVRALHPAELLATLLRPALP